MPLRSQYATASSLVSKCRVSCCFMSPEEVQPISGSIARGCSGSYSRRHSLVWARPDCIAFLAGLKMRAVMDGGVPLRNDIEAVGRNVQDGTSGIWADDSCLNVTR